MLTEVLRANTSPQLSLSLSTWVGWTVRLGKFLGARSSTIFSIWSDFGHGHVNMDTQSAIDLAIDIRIHRIGSWFFWTQRCREKLGNATGEGCPDLELENEVLLAELEELKQVDPMAAQANAVLMGPLLDARFREQPGEPQPHARLGAGVRCQFGFRQGPENYATTWTQWTRPSVRPPWRAMRSSKSKRDETTTAHCKLYVYKVAPAGFYTQPESPGILYPWRSPVGRAAKIRTTSIQKEKYRHRTRRSEGGTSEHGEWQMVAPEISQHLFVIFRNQNWCL